MATGDDNYITVKFYNSDIGTPYHANSIEKAYGSNSKDNINYYNALISKALQKDIKDGVLAEYNCSVEVSNKTKRVYKVTFTKK